jgi:hypothetical protein
LKRIKHGTEGVINGWDSQGVGKPEKG